MLYNFQDIARRVANVGTLCGMLPHVRHGESGHVVVMVKRPFGERAFGDGRRFATLEMNIRDAGAPGFSGHYDMTHAEAVADLAIRAGAA